MAISANHTTYSVLDFLRWQRDGTLVLRAPFQRKSVWRPTLKSSLIDSILQGYPIPALFLQDRSDPKTFSRRLVVVDGQQRLRTVLGYVDLACLDDPGPSDVFTIQNVHDKDRAGSGFDDLSQEDRDRIIDTRLSVEVVGSSVTERQLLEIFRRMNTFGAKLNAQELRNAEYTGVFKELSYGLAGDFLDYWLGWQVLSRQQIAEMRDAEFMSELLLLTVEGTQGSSKASLDAAYSKYDDEFAFAAKSESRVREVMERISEVFLDLKPVKRLANRMWVYSLFDLVQREQFGGPVTREPQERKRLTGEVLVEMAIEASGLIESEAVPSSVAQAIRGAANDRASRVARVEFLQNLIAS